LGKTEELRHASVFNPQPTPSVGHRAAFLELESEHSNGV
jgi:hypothetical protein